MKLAFLTLAITALVTSVISAIIGMGGGILLLAVMLCFLQHREAIPVHAAVQLASNSTRILAYAGSADRRVLGRFAIGVVPGAVLGAFLLRYLAQIDQSGPYLKIVIGLYVLVTPFLPKPKGDAHRGVWWDFPLLGLFAGTLALTVGAVGPLIAPLFARRDFVKERLIATKAACQMVTHVIKIPAFFWLGGFSLGKFGTLTALMVAMVIPGTLLGRRWIKHVSAEAFVMLYRIALVVAGLKVLVFDGLMKVL